MGLLFKHTNDLMLTVGIKQLSRGYVIITDAVCKRFTAGFVLVIAVCAVQWAEFSLRDTGFYYPSVLHGQLHHSLRGKGARV